MKHDLVSPAVANAFYRMASERERERGQSWKWSTTGSCIVCFGEYAYGDDLCRLPCRHVYHAQVRYTGITQATVGEPCYDRVALFFVTKKKHSVSSEFFRKVETQLCKLVCVVDRSRVS